MVRPVSQDTITKIEARGDHLLAQELYGRALAQYDTLAALTGDDTKATQLADILAKPRGILFGIWACKNCGTFHSTPNDTGFCDSPDDACWHEWSKKHL